MQGKLIVKCNGCEKALQTLNWDTADTDDAWIKRGQEAQRWLLHHRKECPFYKKGL